MSRDIDNPIFMVGMPRSGTTMTFQMLAAHEDLGWFSQVNDRFPRFPATSALSRLTDLNPTFRKANVRSDQRRRLVERLRLGPAEAYDLWEHMVGEQFLHEFLIGVEASPGERHRVRETVDQVLRYQGKPRFAAKTTGPARIGYLNSIFPHAHFIHLVRDGRAAVRSLLNVGFWRDTWRMNEPAWRGGMSEDRLSRWREEGSDPAELAAMQWTTVIESARAEAATVAPERYAEIRYEDMVREPRAVIESVIDFVGLAPSTRASEYLAQRVTLRDMNERWREAFGAERLERITDLMTPTLARLGYDHGGDPSPVDQPLRRPLVKKLS